MDVKEESRGVDGWRDRVREGGVLCVLCSSLISSLVLGVF